MKKFLKILAITVTTLVAGFIVFVTVMIIFEDKINFRMNERIQEKIEKGELNFSPPVQSSHPQSSWYENRTEIFTKVNNLLYEDYGSQGFDIGFPSVFPEERPVKMVVWAVPKQTEGQSHIVTGFEKITLLILDKEIEVLETKHINLNDKEIVAEGQFGNLRVVPISENEYTQLLSVAGDTKKQPEYNRMDCGRDEECIKGFVKDNLLPNVSLREDGCYLFDGQIFKREHHPESNWPDCYNFWYSHAYETIFTPFISYEEGLGWITFQPTGEEVHMTLLNPDTKTQTEFWGLPLWNPSHDKFITSSLDISGAQYYPTYLTVWEVNDGELNELTTWNTNYSGHQFNTDEGNIPAEYLIDEDYRGVVGFNDIRWISDTELIAEKYVQSQLTSLGWTWKGGLVGYVKIIYEPRQ